VRLPSTRGPTIAANGPLTQLPSAAGDHLMESCPVGLRFLMRRWSRDARILAFQKRLYLLNITIHITSSWVQDRPCGFLHEKANYRCKRVVDAVAPGGWRSSDGKSTTVVCCPSVYATSKRLQEVFKRKNRRSGGSDCFYV
jgi:hypothetical protein